MIPKFSVKKPYTVAVAVVMVLVLGIVSFTNMTTDLMPSMDLPYVVVNTPYPGANPEKVETEVTRPLEQALAATSGLENISSTSSENVSSIFLEFNEDTNLDSVMIDVSGKIDMAEGNFPDEVSSPIIMKLNPDMMPIMMLSVDVEGKDIEEVTKYVNEIVLPEFERIDGVASVTPMGLIEDQLKVTLDSDKIDAVNDKILANVDSEFSEQEKSLNDAESQIQSSKNELTSQMGSEKENLEKAAEEISKAKEELQTAVDAIGMTKEELQEAIDTTNKELIKLEIKIDELKLSLNILPEPQQEAVLAQIAELEKVAKELEGAIEGSKKGIEAIDALEELKKQEQELKAGIATMDTELKKAEAELNSGADEIKSAKEQLSDAKEGAYQAADMKDKITPDMIGNILMAQNFSMPAGYVSQDEIEYGVKVGESFRSQKEIEDLLLFDTGIDGVGKITVSDVANVEFVNNEGDAYTNINGSDAIILTFQKSSGYSTTDVTDKIHETMEKITSVDTDTSLVPLMDQGIYINLIIDSVLSNLVSGGVLAIVVLLLFLRSIKTTVVVAFSIPISLLFAIVLMYFSDVTLNIISLSGLALGVGMLVDNSIVVIENIYRLKNEGVPIHRASVIGTRQVSSAIFASTLTTISVFFPIVFADGITKQMFTDMGLTIAYSLIASLLVALTVVPAMSSTLITDTVQKEGRFFTGFVDSYERLLRGSLNKKWIVGVLVTALLIFSGYSALTMPTSFMPTMESNEMSVNMSVEKDTPRSEVIEASNEFIDRALEIDDIETIAGLEMSGMGMGSSSDITFYIMLKEDKVMTNAEVTKLLEENAKGINAEFEVMGSNMDMSAFAGSGLSIQVEGKDLDKIQEISNEIAKILEDTEGTTDVSNGLEEADTEARVIVDENKAMEYGLTVAQVYQLIAGDLQEGKNVTNVSIENKDYPVIVASDVSISKDELLNKEISGTKDTKAVKIKLSEIATVEEVKALNSISRDNQVRYMTVGAAIDEGHNIGLVSREVEKKLEDYKLPDGYTIEMKGEDETINEAMGDMLLMGAMAVLFVYLIMVAQFQSLLSPFIVMFTMPLAFTGGILALLVTGQELSVVSMLGFLVLAGVVVNNGIVFVDYINQLRLEGYSKLDAIIKTGKDRLRPILMTALTTILAMSTMAMAVGMGAEMTQGLAIVTIGGLLYSTVLTLFVIPVLYDLLHRKELKPIIIDED